MRAVPRGRGRRAAAAAHGLHAQQRRPRLPQGRVGGRRGRARGGLPGGAGGGRRQGRHQPDCARDVGVQEQEQPGEQRQPPGRLQGLHLRAGGGRGAGAVAGAGHPRQAVGLPGGRVPPLPLRLDARGAVGAAGPPGRAQARRRGRGDQQQRPRRRVHEDGQGGRGSSGGALLAHQRQCRAVSEAAGDRVISEQSPLLLGVVPNMCKSSSSGSSSSGTAVQSNFGFNKCSH